MSNSTKGYQVKKSASLLFPSLRLRFHHEFSEFVSKQLFLLLTQACALAMSPTISIFFPLQVVVQQPHVALFTQSMVLFAKASQVARVVKNLPTNTADVREMGHPWVGKIPWKSAWQPTPVFLPGESRGQTSLSGYHPSQGGKESDTTESTAQHSTTSSLNTLLLIVHELVPASAGTDQKKEILVRPMHSLNQNCIQKINPQVIHKHITV